MIELLNFARKSDMVSVTDILLSIPCKYGCLKQGEQDRKEKTNLSSCGMDLWIQMAGKF